MTRTILLTGASTLALSLTAALPAQAQCVQTVPTVTCASDDTDGFASGLDGLTIDVLTGVTVENSSGDAFDLNGTDNQSITNDGSILSPNNRAIDVNGGDVLFVDNTGEISAEDDAIRGDDGITVINQTTGFIQSLAERGIRGGDSLFVENDGEIEAENDAISGGDDMIVLNGFDGIIFSASQEGIEAGDGEGLTVTNEGLIEAGDEGIQAGLGATIVNTIDGGIFAVDDAIQIEGDGTITNDGIITSFDEDGLDVDSGTIVNGAFGVIGSFAAGGIDVDAVVDVNGVSPSVRSLTIVNEGLIGGETGVLVDPLNMESQDLTNSGSIVGFSGIAVDLGAADDRVTVFGDGEFLGDVLFGDGDDVLDLADASGGFVGGFDTLFDGGSENIADLIELGSGVTLADIFVFDDRTPGRTRMGFTNAFGNQIVIFNDFELFDLDGTTYTSAE